MTRRGRAVLMAMLSTLSIHCNDAADVATRVAGLTTVYSGTVAGNARVDIPNPLYIVGMKVELRMKDGGGDTVLAEGVTEEGGRFELDFEHASEDEDLELYLKFIAETEDGMIRVRQRVLGVKSTRNAELFKTDPIVVDATSPELDHEIGDVLLDPTSMKPQLLHWANRARTFVERELPFDSPLPTDPNDPLDLMVPPLGLDGANKPSFFVPAQQLDNVVTAIVLGFIPASLGALTAAAYVQMEFSDQDALYIASGMETSEQSVLHEFGHYLMWHAQGQKWLNPIQASFASHSAWTNSSNSKIAWTEGFADGFAYIVDSASWQDDGVRADDSDSKVPETPGSFPTCGAGSGSTCNNQGVSHGFFSELYVGSVLYDVWDGRDNLDLVVSDPDSLHDDSTSDLVELSFDDLVRPLLDTKDQPQDALVDNIVDYYERLYALTSEPALKDVFDFDKIRNLHLSAATDFRIEDHVNTDAIAFERAVEVELYRLDSNNQLVKSIGTQIEDFTVDVQRLTAVDDRFNLSSHAAGVVTGELVDDLVLTGTPAAGAATLTFNQAGPYGWQSAFNTYGEPLSAWSTQEPDFEVTLRSGMVLDVVDQASVVLGQSGGSHRATVIVEDGATLNLGGGLGGANPVPEFPTGPLVSKGRLHIHAGSKLIIERGGTLEIEQGSEIVVEGELVIRGILHVRSGGTFEWTAPNGGMVTFDLKDQDGAPNVVMDPDSRIRIRETAFTIAPKTYVRPSTGPARTIIIEEAATGLFGKDAYLDVSDAVLTLESSTIQPLDGADHLGVVLNGGAHSITGMLFIGGTRCVLDGRAGVPLSISDSELRFCETGIETTTTALALNLVTITGSHTGVRTVASPSVHIVDSTIESGGIGWHASAQGIGVHGLNRTTVSGQLQFGVLVEGSNGRTVSLLDSRLSGSHVGLQSDGRIRLRNATNVVGNDTGVQMVGANAVLDLAGSSSSTFAGNAVSIQLDAAGKPILDGGNGFYPDGATPGFALAGTISDSTGCTPAKTISVTSDRWHWWNSLTGTWIPQAMTASPYDVKSTAGCTYTLVP